MLCVALLLTATSIEAQTPANVRIRGTITAVDATTLSVKSRDGKDLKIALPEAVTVSFPKAVRLDDVKEGLRRHDHARRARRQRSGDRNP